MRVVNFHYKFEHVEEGGPGAQLPALVGRQLLLLDGDASRARELLRLARDVEKGGDAEDLDYALLLDRAGGFSEAEKLTFEIVARNSDDVAIVVLRGRAETLGQVVGPNTVVLIARRSCDRLSRCRWAGALIATAIPRSTCARSWRPR